MTSARRLFTEHGYASTSVDDIAADARVTKGAVYHHFANKQALFRTVYLEIEAEMEALSATAASGATSILDGILRGVDAYLDAALRDDVRQITLIDAPSVLGSPPRGAPDGEERHIELRDVIHAAVRAGAMNDVDADCLAHLIRGGCVQAAILIARSSQPESTRARVGATLHTLLNGLVPAK